MARFQNFKGSWHWCWPWIRSYCIPSCITHRPLSTRHAKFHWNWRNLLWMDGRTFETHFIRLTLGIFTPHTPTNTPLLPGLAHWMDIKVSALGSIVGWTPARNNEQTTSL